MINCYKLKNNEDQLDKNKEEENITQDDTTIYNYNDKYWNKKYLSYDLISTNYEAKLITTKVSFGIYQLHFFKDNFCNELVSDLKKFDGWTQNRHKNYPTNDILLKDYNDKLYNLYTCCLKNIVIPIINKIYEGSTFLLKN